MIRNLYRFILPSLLLLTPNLASAYEYIQENGQNPSSDTGEYVYSVQEHSTDSNDDSDPRVVYVSPDSQDTTEDPRVVFVTPTDENTTNTQATDPLDDDYFQDDDDYPVVIPSDPYQLPLVKKSSSKNKAAQSEISENEPAPKKEKSKRAKYYISGRIAADFHFDTFLGKEDAYTNIFGGLSGAIRFGMLGQDFHWSIEQQFGHIWGLHIISGSKDLTRYNAATLIELNMSYSMSKYVDLFYSLGAGFLYNLPHSGTTPAYGDYLAVDKRGTNLAVGVKLGVSVLYYVTRNFAIGADLSYMMGLDIGSYIEGEFQDRNGNYRNDDKLMVEILQPGFILFYKF